MDGGYENDTDMVFFVMLASPWQATRPKSPTSGVFQFSSKNLIRVKLKKHKLQGLFVRALAHQMTPGHQALRAL